MKATITSKGQITIPAAIRARLGLKAGQVLDFDESVPYLKAHRPRDAKAMRAVLGSKKKELAGKTTAEWIEWLRGPIELPPHASKRR